MKNHIANLITALRIVCAIAMTFFPVFSVQFYITYMLCGLSDIADGAVARITNTTSISGAIMDTIADFIFVSAALFKFLTSFDIPVWLWIWIVLIAIIRLGNIVYGFVYTKNLISMHTSLNKTTGLLLFLMPFTLGFIELEFIAIIICFVAISSAIQESYYISKGMFYI